MNVLNLLKVEYTNKMNKKSKPIITRFYIDLSQISVRVSE